MTSAAGDRPGDANRPPVTEVLERHRAALQGLPGVLGVGAGLSSTGSPAIIVFLVDASAASGLPSELEGHPVQPVATGPVDAL